MVSLELMDKIKIFQDLDDDQLTAIQNCCSEAEFNRGDKFFSEGDLAAHLWVVLEGQVDLRLELPGGKPTSRDHTVTSISAKPSESIVLGWSCFVAPYKMRLSAYCSSRHCKLIKIAKNSLIALFNKNPRTGYLIMSHLITIAGIRFHQLQEMVVKDLGEKLMCGW